MRDQIMLDEFIKTYVKAIRQSEAAVFAGAGLSRPSGYVDWKELLRDVANELALNIDKETDLIAVAQYHVNEFGGRNKLNQVLMEEFTKDVNINENQRILASLPIETYWTTNYDTLLDEALQEAKRRVDIKRNQESLANNYPYRRAVIYKMHGCINMPSEAVITKDDYEKYNEHRQLFTTMLQGDLISKTFLFIGFSFDDPNLNYILSRIRILLGENQRTHYCLMKRVSEEEYDNIDEFRYAEIKQELRIKDLRRYCINVVLVDTYEQITDVLLRIHNILKRNNIFVSGSAIEYGDWEENRAFEFVSNLSKRIIKNGNNLVSGFGLGIGSCTVSGALEETYKGTDTVEQRMILRPFPQDVPDGVDRKAMWTRYRQDMLSNVGVAVFIFGNKFKDGKTVLADGMIEEFEIALQNNVVPIPIGITGYTSGVLWSKVMNSFDKYIPDGSLKESYESLGDADKTDEEILDIVISIIKRVTG